MDYTASEAETFIVTMATLAERGRAAIRRYHIMLKSVVGAGYFTEVRTSMSITILIINSLRNTACSIAC
jgi:hypothetical protein